MLAIETGVNHAELVAINDAVQPARMPQPPPDLPENPRIPPQREPMRPPRRESSRGRVREIAGSLVSGGANLAGSVVRGGANLAGSVGSAVVRGGASAASSVARGASYVGGGTVGIIGDIARGGGHVTGSIASGALNVGRSIYDILRSDQPYEQLNAADRAVMAQHGLTPPRIDHPDIYRGGYHRVREDGSIEMLYTDRRGTEYYDLSPQSEAFVDAEQEAHDLAEMEAFSREQRRQENMALVIQDVRGQPS